MRPEWPSDPTSLRTTTGFAFTDEGQGPPIVAVHGAPGSSRDFRWLAPALTDCGLRLIRIDLPGFGDTPAAAWPGHTVATGARFLTSALEHLQLERPTVLGHSLGGLISVAVAAHRPDLVHRLCLVSCPGLVIHRGIAHGRRFAGTVVAEPWRARLLKPLVTRMFRASGFTAPYPYDVMVQTLRLMASIDFTRHAANVHRLEVPTLVAWCRDDPLIEDWILRDLAEACPTGPRLVFDEGGHNPQKHHAVEIARAIATW